MFMISTEEPQRRKRPKRSYEGTHNFKLLCNISLDVQQEDFSKMGAQSKKLKRDQRKLNQKKLESNSRFYKKKKKNGVHVGKDKIYFLELQ